MRPPHLRQTVTSMANTRARSTKSVGLKPKVVKKIASAKPPKPEEPPADPKAKPSRKGRVDVNGLLAEAFDRAFNPLLTIAGAVAPTPPTPERSPEHAMRIAIPLANGRLAQHFGHCAAFALLDVDLDRREILTRQDVPAPDHQPGLLPPWLAERGANIILAGGMGSRAQQLFAHHGIQVIVGVPSETPEALVTAWMAGTLVSG